MIFGWMPGSNAPGGRKRGQPVPELISEMRQWTWIMQINNIMWQGWRD